jgi:polyisoprenoid-binding protein YceI
MKKSRLLLSITAAGAIFLTSCGGEQKTENSESAAAEETTTTAEAVQKDVNLEESSVKWEGEMIGIKAHWGYLDLTEATVEMTGDKITGGSFVADMTTIDPQDDMYTEEQTPEKLVGHLSSPDFFDVANHPTASFEITSVSEDGSTATGDLTIRGITHEEKVNDITIADGVVTGELTFDRKKYDVSWKAPMQDAVLSDDIPLTIELKVAG